MTIKEEFIDFKNVVLTFIGDGNNVANSLILYGALLGVEELRALRVMNQMIWWSIELKKYIRITIY